LPEGEAFLVRSAQRLKAFVGRVSGNFAQQFASTARFLAEPWFIDAIDTSGSLTVQGWAFVDEPRPGGDYSARFRFNGRRFDRVDYPLERKDVGDCFRARQGAKDCGFVLVANDVANPYPGGTLEVVCSDRATPPAASGRDSWFIPDPDLHRDLPDEDRRFRVIGNRDPSGFLMSGCTDFHRLDRACFSISGKHIAEHASVLDWGCGCGRIARHLPRLPHRFRGCDIDADNVAWCTGHLPGRYSTSSLRPPLPYEEAAFDLIYGVSVFTHFRPELEALWLAELKRVAAPGALLMMTVHGRTTVDYARHGVAARYALLKRIEHEGILCSARNAQLDGHAVHEDEYVNVYHSQRYIDRTWGRHFEIVAVLPGYLFTHDLVIMRSH
jgi:SAM-dependent methyltransferase